MLVLVVITAGWLPQQVIFCLLLLRVLRPQLYNYPNYTHHFLRGRCSLEMDNIKVGGRLLICNARVVSVRVSASKIIDSQILLCSCFRLIVSFVCAPAIMQVCHRCHVCTCIFSDVSNTSAPAKAVRNAVYLPPGMGESGRGWK